MIDYIPQHLFQVQFTENAPEKKTAVSLKITSLEIQPCVPGANELHKMVMADDIVSFSHAHFVLTHRIINTSKSSIHNVSQKLSRHLFEEEVEIPKILSYNHCLS